MKLMEITAGVYFGIFRCVAILQNIYWFLGWGSSMWPTSSLSTPWVSLIPSAAWIVLRGLFFKSLFKLISNLHLHSTVQNATKFEYFHIISTLTLSCTVYVYVEERLRIYNDMLTSWFIIYNTSTITTVLCQHIWKLIEI